MRTGNILRLHFDGCVDKGLQMQMNPAEFIRDEIKRIIYRKQRQLVYNEQATFGFS